MYVCMYVCMYVYMYVCMYVKEEVREDLYMQAGLQIPYRCGPATYVCSTCIHEPNNVNVCIYVCMYV
jgi:hypothetical protein